MQQNRVEELIGGGEGFAIGRPRKGMRVRRLIATPKLQTSDTGWSANDMPPRHCPIYTKTRPIRAGWKWRSAACEVGGTRHFLVALCNTRRDNWQAFLIVDTTIGVSVVARFEHHGSHPGLHGHAHCDRGGVETSASGLDGLVRTPPSGAVHRRTNAWTEQTFWEAARRFFRVTDNMAGQRQLTLV
jgi:hypothetical protein